jgi:polysaccharide biosynthesis/export protein
MTRHSDTRTLGHSVLFALLALILSGCQSRLSYRAVDLPADLAARRIFNVRQFDISRLGNTGVGADLIQTRDTLRVHVSSGAYEDEGRQSELRVTEQGTIDIPYVGQVQVAGLTESQAVVAIRNASVQRQIFMRPSVSVMFAKRHMHHVAVRGAVQKSGTYELRANASTLAAAIRAAGGLSGKASPQITVHIPGGDTTDGLGNNSIQQVGHHSSNARIDEQVGPKVIQVSLLSPERSTSTSQQNLPDGTVITVQEQSSRYVTMMGLTGNGVVELPDDREFRLVDAIAQSGGPKYSPWIANKLKIMRPHPQTGEAVAIRVRLGEAQKNREANIPLAAGDIVSIEETPLTFAISTVSALIGVGRNALTVGGL